jgi:hypothetical protein
VIEVARWRETQRLLGDRFSISGVDRRAGVITVAGNARLEVLRMRRFPNDIPDAREEYVADRNSVSEGSLHQGRIPASTPKALQTKVYRHIIPRCAAES